MDAHLAGSSSRRIAESLSGSKRHGSGKFCVGETTAKAVDRKKYPIRADGYVLYEEVGHGVSASVYRALCVPVNEIVAIKILDFERTNSDLNNISREAQTMMLLDHDHLLCSYCSFVHDHSLWVVMPYMAGGSCLHVLQAAYPDGFEEPIIATLLWQTLKGLLYLHHHGQIHRDVKAGNILIDANGVVKLGDFGISACLFDSGDRQRGRNTFAGTPCWMAPEVMDPKCGYDLKADIWSFGITALELAHGHAPFSKYPPMKVLLMTLQNAPPGLDYERDRKFSKLFRQMIAVCLVKDPTKRPSAAKLARHPFFRQAKSSDYIARTILDGLPELGERLKELKLKEENLVAQKKMPSGMKEELSLSEYKRGISGWDFNMEDLKAQASLIQDAMESMPEYEQSGSSNCSCELGILSEKEVEAQFPFPPFLKDNVVENEDDDKKNTNMKELKDDSWENSYGMHVDDDDHSTCDGSQHSRGLGSELELESDTLCGVERFRSKQIETIGNTNDANHILSENSHKGAKLTVSKSDVGEKPKGFDVNEMIKELDNEKSKGPQVGPHYLKGRFKVTENVDKEKPGVALGAYDASVSNHIGNANMSQLHTMFQSINSLRDNFIVLMKQISNGQMYSGELQAGRGANGGSTPNQSVVRPSQEAMKDREKELLQEIAELNGRLACAHDELEKLRAKSSQT